MDLNTPILYLKLQIFVKLSQKSKKFLRLKANKQTTIGLKIIFPFDTNF